MTSDHHNPYNPPAANVSDPASGQGSPVKAVLVGTGVDVGGTVATSFVLGIVYAASVAASGASPEEISSQLSNIPLDSGLAITGMLFGCAFSVLGGYLCARIARHSELRLGAITAAISAAIGLLLSFQQYSVLMNLGLTAATFVTVLIGARLGAARNLRSKA